MTIDRATLLTACLQAAAIRTAKPPETAPNDAELVRAALDLLEECERQMADRWPDQFIAEHLRESIEAANEAAEAHRKRLRKDD